MEQGSAPALNTLEKLSEHSIIVADTGDWEEVAKFQPRDVTTNPTLIFKNIEKLLKTNATAGLKAGLVEKTATSKFLTLLAKTVQTIKHATNQDAVLREALDELFIQTGALMLAQISGRISSEVPARLAFNKAATLAHARTFIRAYEQLGFSKERILIKIPATWEGLLAAEVLEREGIHTNLTLIFGFEQARRAADVGVTLISPFVGRVTDWYKVYEGKTYYPPTQDPGVQAVNKIYAYFKEFNYKTEVMAASFRNIEQILALAGCDLLTIAPKLLGELQASEVDVPRMLTPDGSGQHLEAAVGVSEGEPSLSEGEFRWELNQNVMASEKLGEGIRLFHKASSKLRDLLCDAKLDSQLTRLSRAL